MPAADAAVRDLPPEPEAFGRLFGFPRSHRLVDPRQFSHVFDHRHTQHTSGRCLVCHWAPNKYGHARLGLAISRRALRYSTTRSLLKRLVREHFRQHPLPSIDLIVTCRRGLKVPLDRQAVRKDLNDLWPKLV